MVVLLLRVPVLTSISPLCSSIRRWSRPRLSGMDVETSPPVLDMNVPLPQLLRCPSISTRCVEVRVAVTTPRVTTVITLIAPSASSVSWCRVRSRPRSRWTSSGIRAWGMRRSTSHTISPDDIPRP